MEDWSFRAEFDLQGPDVPDAFGPFAKSVVASGARSGGLKVD